MSMTEEFEPDYGNAQTAEAEADDASPKKRRGRPPGKRPSPAELRAQQILADRSSRGYLDGRRNLELNIPPGAGPQEDGYSYFWGNTSGVDGMRLSRLQAQGWEPVPNLNGESGDYRQEVGRGETAVYLRKPTIVKDMDDRANGLVHREQMDEIQSNAKEASRYGPDARIKTLGMPNI